MDIAKILEEEFNLQPYQVNNTIKLLEEGNTIPFIARYRKELTGNLKDTVLRKFSERLNYLNNLKNRQNEILKLIESQGKLTEELKNDILEAKTIQRLEDLYRPFRPKRKTRASIAREKGLEGLAEVILSQSISKDELKEKILEYIDEEKGVSTEEDALCGAMDIIAEEISDNANFRDMIKKIAYRKGMIKSEAVDTEAESPYEMYYGFKESIRTIPNHRILAINRGEKEKFLKVSLVLPDDEVISQIKSQVIKRDTSDTSEYLEKAIEDSYKRLIFPSIEREIRAALTERAEEEAIDVFALNLRPLLMQPPVRGAVIMGIDPAYRTGCKVAIIDETGKLLKYTTVYPTEPQNKVREAKEELKGLIHEYNVNIIAIGNGTGSRETEMVIAELINEIDKEVYYTIVNEAGASVYSASEVGQAEFPDLDVSIRGAISIARRLQDPLAELVKIDPKHIGIGQYQHDLNQSKLEEALKGVVEDCVNTVGVDLNTASPSLLKYVAGISYKLALNIVEYREKGGKFRNREELLKVKETKENFQEITDCVFDHETECPYPDKIVTIIPINSAGERLGTLVIARYGRNFTEEDLVLAEYSATIVGMEILRAKNEEIEEESRKKAVVQMAIGTLSYSELEAMEHIFKELDGDEGLIVASKVADRVGITRSVIVNALRKFESAGVIESRSLGMKGTHIKILNDKLLEELQKVRES